jgi:hypothetical protein
VWNGKDVWPELRELPAGRYVVEAVGDEAPALTPEEAAGIETALESYRQGRVVDAKRSREIIDAALRRLKPYRKGDRRHRSGDHLYLTERNPTVATKLDAEVGRCVER